MIPPAELKALLKAHGVRLTKRLGQHHLISPNVIERIVASCELSGDETVLEIGAGLGALTEPLAKRVRRLIALEVDPRIAKLLSHRVSSLKNVAVICQDVLDINWGRTKEITVIGAIPYAITSPILISISRGRRSIRKCVLVLQHEVARRLVAVPGTKAYGRLSILGQYCWDIKAMFSIARSAFFPQPDVDSACVRFLPHAVVPIQIDNERRFFELVKAAFAHRRKSLVNCLSGYAPRRLNRPQVEMVLHELGLPFSIRGEMLSMGQFAELANACERLGPSKDQG